MQFLKCSKTQNNKLDEYFSKIKALNQNSKEENSLKKFKKIASKILKVKGEIKTKEFNSTDFELLRSIGGKKYF